MTAWLIEDTINGRPYWFTLSDGVMTYTANRDSGIRFAREEDALAMMGHEFFNTNTLKVTGHHLWA